MSLEFSLNDSSSLQDVAVDISSFVAIDWEEVDEESNVPVIGVDKGSPSKLRSSLRVDASLSMSVVNVVGGVDRGSRTKSNSGKTTLGARANEILLCFFLTVVAALNWLACLMMLCCVRDI